MYRMVCPRALPGSNMGTNPLRRRPYIDSDSRIVFSVFEIPGMYAPLGMSVSDLWCLCLAQTWAEITIYVGLKSNWTPDA